MAKDIFNKITLKFTNSSYEQEFQALDVKSKFRLHVIMVIFYSLLEGSYFIHSGIEYSLVTHLILLVILALIGYVRKSLIPYTNFVMIVGTVVVFVFFIQNQDHIQPSESFIQGQGSAMIFLVSSQSLVFDFSAVIVCQIAIKLLMSADNYYMLEGIHIVVVSSLFKYLQQRNERKAFFEKKKQQQWNENLDILFSNYIIISKFDPVTNKVSLHDCNHQARKFGIDSESFIEMSKDFKIDIQKSKMSLELSPQRLTLKDYLLEKHFICSNIKSSQLAKKNSIMSPLNNNRKNNESRKDQEEDIIFKKMNSISIKKSIVFDKNDILSLSYQCSKVPGKKKLFKVNAGVLIFEEPFIILSMQDVSSEKEINTLKKQSNATDVIYLRGINEMREKIVKLITFIEYKFQQKSLANINSIRSNKITDDALISLDNQNIQKQDKQEENSRFQFPSPRLRAVSNNIGKSQNNIADPNQYSQQTQNTVVTLKIDQQYSKKGNDEQQLINPQEMTSQEKLVQADTHFMFPSLTNLENTEPIASPPFCLSKSIQKKTLLLPPSQTENPWSQSNSNRHSSSRDNLQKMYVSPTNKNHYSEAEEVSETSMHFTNRINTPRSFGQINGYRSSKNNYSFEGDSFQTGEGILDYNNEVQIQQIKQRLTYMLNNTYSLLDYVILASEKSQFKKLSVKSRTFSLKKIESFLKPLFPNVQVSYSHPSLSNKEVVTDVRRLKYILISIISSYFKKLKEKETLFLTSEKNICLQNSHTNYSTTKEQSQDKIMQVNEQATNQNIGKQQHQLQFQIEQPLQKEQKISMLTQDTLKDVKSKEQSFEIFKEGTNHQPTKTFLTQEAMKDIQVKSSVYKEQLQKPLQNALQNVQGSREKSQTVKQASLKEHYQLNKKNSIKEQMQLSKIPTLSDQFKIIKQFSIAEYMQLRRTPSIAGRIAQQFNLNNPNEDTINSNIQDKGGQPESLKSSSQLQIPNPTATSNSSHFLQNRTKSISYPKQQPFLIGLNNHDNSKNLNQKLNVSFQQESKQPLVSIGNTLEVTNVQALNYSNIQYSNPLINSRAQNISVSKTQNGNHTPDNAEIEAKKIQDLILHISLNEQYLYSSVMFSIFPSEYLNAMNLNKQQDDYSFYFQEKNNEVNLSNFNKNTQSHCFNSTQDNVIRQMEIKNILMNIMRIGPNAPIYDVEKNSFCFEIFENADILQQLPLMETVTNKNTSHNYHTNLNTNYQNQILPSHRNLLPSNLDTATVQSKSKNSFFDNMKSFQNDLQADKNQYQLNLQQHLNQNQYGTSYSCTLQLPQIDHIRKKQRSFSDNKQVDNQSQKQNISLKNSKNKSKFQDSEIMQSGQISLALPNIKSVHKANEKQIAVQEIKSRIEDEDEDDMEDDEEDYYEQPRSEEKQSVTLYESANEICSEFFSSLDIQQLPSFKYQISHLQKTKEDLN